MEVAGNMTDRQYDGILQMIEMIVNGCKDLDEAKRKIAELRKVVCICVAAVMLAVLPKILRGCRGSAGRKKEGQKDEY